MSESQKLFALLIDGDHATPVLKLIPQVLTKIKQYGTPIIRRVYGNENSIKAWDKVAQAHDLEHKLVTNNTKGKNVVDFALVIAAMDLLHDRPELTGFCIVTSDGDFTELANNIKGKGKFVIGIGANQTPKPFIQACSVFVYVKSLSKLPVSNIPAPQSTTPKASIPKAKVPKVATSNPSPHLNQKPMPKPQTSKPTTATPKTSAPKAATPETSAPKITPAPTSKAKTSSAKATPKAPTATPRTAVSKASVISAPKTHGPKPTSPQKAVLKTTSPKVVKSQTHTSKTPRVKAAVIELPKATKWQGPPPQVPTSEFEGLYKAYKHAADVKMLKDKDGWVMLAIVEDTVRELYVDHNPLIYDGTRYKQLLEVIRAINKARPDAIEITELYPGHPQIRIKP